MVFNPALYNLDSMVLVSSYDLVEYCIKSPICACYRKTSALSFDAGSDYFNLWTDVDWYSSKPMVKFQKFQGIKKLCNVLMVLKPVS